MMSKAASYMFENSLRRYFAAIGNPWPAKHCTYLYQHEHYKIGCNDLSDVECAGNRQQALGMKGCCSQSSALHAVLHHKRNTKYA